MTALQEKVEAYSALLKDIREEFMKDARALWKEAWTDLWESYPEVSEIQWRQYTPYFNDGDECVFGVANWTFSTTNEALLAEGGSWSDDLFEEYDLFDYLRYDNNQIVRKDNVGVREYVVSWGEQFIQDVNALLGSLPQDIMKDLFGDHALVRATREGFEVEEYEHD